MQVFQAMILMLVVIILLLWLIATFNSRYNKQVEFVHTKPNMKRSQEKANVRATFVGYIGGNNIPPSGLKLTYEETDDAYE